MRKSTNNQFTYLYFSLFLLVVTLSTFTYVTVQVSKHDITNFDKSVISYVQSFVNPQLNSLIKVFTEFGSVKIIAVVVVIISAILFLKRKVALSLFVFIGTAAGGVFNLILKSIIQRERPDILPIVDASGYSFPSGHSMGSIIFYGSIAYIIVLITEKKLLQWLTIISFSLLILLIGISRIYLGVHYPTDVVAGFAFGGAWLAICITVFRYYVWRQDAGAIYVRSK